MKEWWEEPWIAVPSILAAIVVTGLTIAKLIIPAIGVAVGLAGQILKAGIAGAIGAGVLPAVLVPIATTSVTVVAISITVKVLTGLAEKAKRHPYEWILPVLAILGGFITDIAKEFTFWKIKEEGLEKAVLGAFTAVTFLLGGLLWKDGGPLRKIGGVILFLLSPAWILLVSLSRHPGHSLSELLRGVEGSTWVAVGALLGVLLLAAFFAFVFREEKQR